MKRQHIAGIYAAPEAFGGQTLTVCGWARTIRDMKNFGFIELNDGSCFKSLQVVLERGKLENYDDIARQNVGAAFIVHGELVLTPDAKQPFELKADSITLEGASAPDYPLQKKRHSVEFLRTIQHLRPRTNLFSATFRVRSVAAQAVHTFFQDRGFVYVQTPIITGSDCEGAGEMFRVTTLDLDNLPRTDDGKVDFSKDFFGKETKGLPEAFLEAHRQSCVRIPMRPEARSLNLSNAVAVTVFEALRQLSFPHLKDFGKMRGENPGNLEEST